MIKLKNLCLDYPLSPIDGLSLKSAVFKILSASDKVAAPVYRALKNIDLFIAGQERVGVIGLNGSGKSTLLRVISGIYQPTEGEIDVKGKVSPLLDLATGFELHHTGTENIRIRLMFLGETPENIEKKIPEIAEFADLGIFLDMPAKTYSAGMFMRLAFATSTSINPEILVVDEVVGAGDAQFADKAQDRVEQLLSSQSTMIISSHSMELIRKFCTRVIWLNKGEIMLDGDCDQVIEAYETFVKSDLVSTAGK